MSDLGPNGRALLDAGRDGDDPTPGDRARLRASVMRAIAAGGVIGAAASESAIAGATVKAASSGLPLVWKVVAGLAVIGAAGGGVAVAVSGGQGAKQAAPPSAVASVPGTSATIPTQPPPDAPSIAAPPPTTAVTAAPAATASSRQVRASVDTVRPAAPIPAANDVPSPAAPTDAPAAPPPPAAPPDPIIEETRKLREAHGALQGGDAARALALLDEQNAGGAELREERAAARVLALCKLGRVDEARAAAAQFLQQSPRSPLADRVRGSCAGTR